MNLPQCLKETLMTHGCPVAIGGDINIHVENLSYVNALCLLELLSDLSGPTAARDISHTPCWRGTRPCYI